jgi:hypothetical protein
MSKLILIRGLTVWKLSKPLDDYTGAHFMIVSDSTTEGVAIIMGGLGEDVESGNASILEILRKAFPRTIKKFVERECGSAHATE